MDQSGGNSVPCKSTQPRARGFLRRLRDTSGNIMPMTAIGMVALAGLVGGGVDVSRAYMIQNRLQNACDAGVLAGRKAITDDGYNASAKAQADDFFDTNFDEATEGASGTTFASTTPDNGSTVDGTATTVVDTAVMQLFGFDTIPLSVTCSASMSVGNSDVMFVLDVTGSMDWDISDDDDTDRIVALQAAMKNFYDTLYAASSGGSARVRYGFVPYSMTVNVGELLYDLDPSYLADSVTIPSREAQKFIGWGPQVYDSGISYDNYSADYWWGYTDYVEYDSSRDCERAMPSATSWSDYGSSSNSTGTYVNSDGQQVQYDTDTQRQRRTVYACYRYRKNEYYIIDRYEYRDEDDYETWTQDPIYTATTNAADADRYRYKAVTYNTSAFKAGTALSTLTGYSSGSYTWENWTWNGCIMERDTVASDSISYTPGTGVSPSGALDLDIDSAPTGDDSTKWKPLIPKLMYIRYTDGNYDTYSTADESDYGSRRSEYCPVEAQLLTSMSESDFDAYVDDLDPVGGTYHDIGMIWGARMASPTGIFSSNVNAAPPNSSPTSRHIIFMTDGEMDTSYNHMSAWGLEWHQKRVTDDGFTDNDDRHQDRLLAACAAAKDKGVRVWVIAFATSLTTTLQTCASPDSSFTASNASELNTYFQEIANDVGELRVVQ